MKSEEPIRQHEILLYTTPYGTVRFEVAFEDETFWLTQKRMAELFGIEIPTSTTICAKFLSLRNYMNEQLLERFE